MARLEIVCRIFFTTLPLILNLWVIQADKIIENPVINNWGTWGTWEYCPAGQYANGFQLKVQSFQGPRKDDTALNGIRLLCQKPGSRNSGSFPTSTVGIEGKWKTIHYCNKNRLLTGFQLRTEPNRGNLRDDTGANNLRGVCRVDGERRSVIYGDGLSFGKWSAEQQCDRGEAICGIQTQVENPGGDSTALNNIKMKCCTITGLTCSPTDRWEAATGCDNLDGVTPLTCSYQRSIGIASNRSRVALNLELVQAVKQKFTQTNSTGGHNWSTESNATWSSATTNTAEFDVPAKTRTTLWQKVGYCGDYAVHSASFKPEHTLNNQ